MGPERSAPAQLVCCALDADPVCSSGHGGSLHGRLPALPRKRRNGSRTSGVAVLELRTSGYGPAGKVRTGSSVLAPVATGSSWQALPRAPRERRGTLKSASSGSSDAKSEVISPNVSVTWRSMGAGISTPLRSPQAMTHAYAKRSETPHASRGDSRDRSEQRRAAQHRFYCRAKTWAPTGEGGVTRDTSGGRGGPEAEIGARGRTHYCAAATRSTASLRWSPRREPSDWTSCRHP